ncbi:HAMP domain-containing sensor histidine kinase [Marinococcus sp. PL1-022]|uniref:HAMP domain-containing sensor histidine kinase n=1 Tax=Marinococcus sp. PL1-022 TaxID=3095363 RepID=UPI0029C1C8D4|nr:HAMP domain-containing sensor histidine kinase [Marinococcus sp. PL1-022]MDX6152698.1 HAMP domain-containing sensor histidine kinase [Marinococcus sp. PL1-022]
MKKSNNIKKEMENIMNGNSNKKGKYGLFSLYNFFAFFFLTMSVCGVNLALYTNLIRHQENPTFFNVEFLILGNLVFISLLMSLVDSLRRKYTIGLPVKKILNALDKMSKGNFEIFISPIHTKRVNEFDEIIDGINRMTEELAKLETLRTDVISNVSHEIKTPLAIIQNYATLQQSSALSEAERIRNAQTIVDATNRLSRMITNILKLNKLENQEIYPTAEEYNLSEQLRCNVLYFEESLTEKNITVETEIENSFIACDKDLLDIVWSNLISNAIKFTNYGGVITVSLYDQRNSIEVLIKDTGSGIDHETGKHIFEKFYQGNHNSIHQGNGLGLAMVKKVIDILKGDINVTSEVGVGTTFKVKIKK